jgi:hypothetical protein
VGNLLLLPDLCGSAAAHGCVADGAVKQRAVQGIETGEQGGYLGYEWVCQDGCYLVVAAAAGIANQLAHVYLKRCCQPLK